MYPKNSEKVLKFILYFNISIYIYYTAILKLGDAKATVHTVQASTQSLTKSSINDNPRVFMSIVCYVISIQPPASIQWMGELHLVTNKSSKLLIANTEGGHSEKYDEYIYVMIAYVQVYKSQ